MPVVERTQAISPTRQPISWRVMTSATHASTVSPAAVFRALHEQGCEPALLSSGDGAAPGGRYSIIAHSPQDQVCVSELQAADPFVTLQAALDRHRLCPGSTLPAVPFCGGWLGYFSYDLGRAVESVPAPAQSDHGFPLLDFRFYKHVLTYDHHRKNWLALCLTTDVNPAEFIPSVSLDATLLECLATASCLVAENKNENKNKNENGAALWDGLHADTTREAYLAKVHEIKRYIEAGDVYQVNLSQRFVGRARVSAMAMATRLLTASPSPFGGCLLSGERAIISASPERFIQVDGRTVETWPIKGTRPRGKSAAADAREKAALIESEKDRAELTMITDLLRNDLGRVSEFGSVCVVEPRAVTAHTNVHHTHSRIVSRLRENVGAAELLRAIFPGGSITGAPKVRAMEIIAEVEPLARGPYCGAMGYFGIDGKIDLNIAIRTIVMNGERLMFQVGGGIVADSDPADEYAETLAKAQGIQRALGVKV